MRRIPSSPPPIKNPRIYRQTPVRPRLDNETECNSRETPLAKPPPPSSSPTGDGATFTFLVASPLPITSGGGVHTDGRHETKMRTSDAVQAFRQAIIDRPQHPGRR